MGLDVSNGRGPIRARKRTFVDHRAETLRAEKIDTLSDLTRQLTYKPIHVACD